MGEVQKRWSVTYTKHLKQKRKVYQDGILHLLCNNKVMLYDEGEQLLDSRFLTKDEVVKSGESLPFTCFLVDIGDLETNPNIISSPNPKSAYVDTTKQNTELQQHRDKFTTHHSKGKLNTARRKTSAINISPSQKIIREFKKNQQFKYEVQQVRSPQIASNSGFTEWEALYTTQITQKAKKYHDGFVRVVTCGSQGRQIMLYDSSKNQLDKRFLKKDEVITSGESLTFDAYLVDIGDHIKTTDDNTDGKNCKMTKKIETTVSQERHNLFADNLISNAQRVRVTAQEQFTAHESATKETAQRRACSRKQVNSNCRSLGAEKMKLGKRLPSHMQLRDAHQILSILRKPAATERTLIGEEVPVKHFPSLPSEPVQLESKRHDFKGPIPEDRLTSGMVVEKCKDVGTENEGYARTFTEGNEIQFETGHDILALTGSHSNNKERPVCSQGIQTVKSSTSVGLALLDRLHASTNKGTRVILDSGEGADFSPVKTENGTHDQLQPQPGLRQADPKTEAAGGWTLDICKPKSSVDDHGCVGSNAKILNGTLDYPSFDLGI